jgi:ketosteroid isomerase-like protein
MAPVNTGPAAGRSDPDVDMVLKSCQAYARGDIDAAVSPLHREVEWIEPGVSERRSTRWLGRRNRIPP